jgi:HEAT repeat protein
LASPEYVRQRAIEALGKIGNPEDCQTMLAIASASKNYTQAEAYIVVGRICRERALPTLASVVGSGDSQLLMGVAGGLVNTSSRDAVSLLVMLLQSPDRNARRHSAAGLATLTHRKSTYGVEDEDSAKHSHAEWLNWWSVNCGTAPMYGYDQCVAPQPLL